MPLRDDLMQILQRRSAIYQVVKDGEGKRLTPLVGYAGKYPTDEGERAYVGETYFDFAMVEQDISSLFQFAIGPSETLRNLGVNVALGAPMGGIAFAVAMADSIPCAFAFAEKKVTAVATADAREVSELVIARHHIPKGARVAVVEDVCNNFSTTGKLFELVRSMEAEVVAIACAINRSEGQVREWEGVRVVAALDIPMPQWRQDDPYVAHDIAAGNVVWKPKGQWQELLNWPLTSV